MAYIGMTGQGATAVLTGASTLSGCVRSISLPEISVEKIDASCLDTTGFTRYISGDLKEVGECNLEIIFDPTYDWAQFGGGNDPIVGELDTLTVTFPIGDPANTTQAVFAGSGFVMSWDLPDLQLNELLVVNLNFCFDGDVGPTWTPESA
jgi:hypothetical protein